jgi:dethiobiotin synthetase
MDRGIFITGTDTGVGKTYVAVGIAAVLRDMLNVGVMKPVETGCSMRKGNLVPRDALRLIKASTVHDEPDLVNPYRFSKPLAPYVAAGLDGKKIGINTIMKAFQALIRKHDFMIVEGAGGIMVPLTKEDTFLDLAQIMRLPVLIVARPGLGTINHTLLTIAAITARRIPIAGVVINYAQKQVRGIAESTNPVTIEKISGVRVLTSVPFNSRDFDSIVASLK